MWVVNAFNLAVAASLCASAGYAGSLGMGRVYRAGALLFAFGSLLCGIGGSFGLLIGARVVQGIGAAMIMAISPAILRAVFPRAQLSRAFGYTALTVSAAGAAGPTIGGLLLAVLPWPWLFAINVPIALIAIVLGTNALPDPPGTGAPVDRASIVASALGFALLVYGADGFGRADPPLLVAGELILGAVAFAWFARRQFRIPIPIVALDLFRIETFARAAATSLAAWIGWGIAFVALPFVLQLDRGYSPLATGLVLTAWPVGNALSAPLAGRWTERVSSSVIAASGLGLFALAIVAFALGSHVLPAPAIAAVAFLAGAGFGAFQAPNNGVLLGSAPLEKSASAAALLAVLRVSGQTAGATAVAVAFAIFERIEPATFARGAAPVVLGAAFVSIVLAAVSSSRNPGGRRRTA